MPSRPITEFASRDVLMGEITVTENPSAYAVHVAHFAAGGKLGRHPTRLWQLFSVVAGAGWVSGRDGTRQAIRAGQAALWEPGEEHESGTEASMIAVIVQSAQRPRTR